MSSRLYRSRDDIISGVCGGIAEYFRVDPTLIRVAWALITVFETSIGIIAYLACAYIIPRNPIKGHGYDVSQDDNEQNNSNSYDTDAKKKSGNTTIGLIFVLIGVIIISRQFFSWLNFGNLWPAALIILGIYILFKSKK